jgi:hypothetical protein
MVGYRSMNVEGTLHIVQFDRDEGYSVSFAPYVSRGGALPQLRLSNSDALVRFLADIGLTGTRGQEALAGLAAKGSVSLQGISLSLEQLRRHNLLELGIAESIMRYLST